MSWGTILVILGAAIPKAWLLAMFAAMAMKNAHRPAVSWPGAAVGGLGLLILLLWTGDDLVRRAYEEGLIQ